MITLTRKFQGINYRRTITGINYVIFSVGANLTRKYSIPDGVSIAGASFAQSASGGTSAGNATYGLFLTSAGARPTYKYTYSGDQISTGTALGASMDTGTGSAAGNADVCLVFAGSSFGATAAMRKYVYAEDTVGAGTSLTGALLRSSATGNAQYAIFRYLAFQANTDRFEFATDTKTVGPLLSDFGTSGGDGSSTGNGFVGLMAAGSVSGGTRVNKITFASNTCVLGTSLTPARSGGSGMCGTTVTGVFGMGGSSLPACLYTYASDTVASSSSDFNSASGPGVCANPVGVNV